MFKEIAEIIVAIVVMIGAVKFWVTARNSKQFIHDLAAARKEFKEAKEQMDENLKNCEKRHEGCALDVQDHLRDKKSHRDIELELLRHDTLLQAIQDIKLDYGKRFDKLESAFLNR